MRLLHLPSMVISLLLDEVMAFALVSPTDASAYCIVQRSMRPFEALCTGTRLTPLCISRLHRPRIVHSPPGDLQPEKLVLVNVRINTLQNKKVRCSVWLDDQWPSIRKSIKYLMPFPRLLREST